MCVDSPVYQAASMPVKGWQAPDPRIGNTICLSSLRGAPREPKGDAAISQWRWDLLSLDGRGWVRVTFAPSLYLSPARGERTQTMARMQTTVRLLRSARNDVRIRWLAIVAGWVSILIGHPRVKGIERSFDRVFVPRQPLVHLPPRAGAPAPLVLSSASGYDKTFRVDRALKTVGLQGWKAFPTAFCNCGRAFPCSTELVPESRLLRGSDTSASGGKLLGVGVTNNRNSWITSDWSTGARFTVSPA